MNQKDKLEIVNQKIDLLFRLMLILPAFFRAVHVRRPIAEWKAAYREYIKIKNEYQKLKEYEHYHDIASKQDRVS